MQLGAFSLSLAVGDIQASKEFYEKLGFRMIAGEIERNWVIMNCGGTAIGLFQDMFEKNILTFCPGLDAQGGQLQEFTDIRKIKADLQAAGLEISNETGEEAEGPASFMVTDPDGNPILFDQHR
ncbi:MAG: VOC family protein [Rhodobacteraceae bacterium]|nr:VOC family protein [Paracoccaceae bacterium]